MTRNYTLTIIAAALLSTSPAFADGIASLGLDDPEVIAPASASGDWTGPYVGLSYGRIATDSTRVECFKLGQSKDCDDPIFDYYPEYKDVVIITSSASTEKVGAFAGYRNDWGRVVGGIEVGALGDLATAEVHLGLDMGRVLIYGLAGAARFEDAEGAIYGVGADMRLGERMLVGAKYIEGNGFEAATLRIGIRF
jgi:outer membrane immunogenic protein